MRGITSGAPSGSPPGKRIVDKWSPEADALLGVVPDIGAAQKLQRTLRAKGESPNQTSRPTLTRIPLSVFTF
jgi:hypothetical protein